MITPAVFTPQFQRRYPRRPSERQQSQDAVIESGDRALEHKRATPGLGALFHLPRA